MRLGELLLLDGLITPDLVDAALSRQALHGARFGSNLVELSAISMEDLAKALGRQHHKPAALEAHYAKIDKTLTVKLTADLAAAWQAVPLGRAGPDHSMVAIATTQPFEKDVRLELEDIFETKIVEAIAPEMRMFYWLEQVYQIDRHNRFKRIARRDSAAPPPAATIDESEDEDESIEIDFSSLEATEQEEIKKRVYVQTLSDAEPTAPVGQLAKIAVKQIAVQRTGEHATPLDVKDWKACVRAIRQSQGRDSIAKVVMEILQRAFDDKLGAGLLLMAKENVALGWRGFARGKSDIDVNALAVGLDADSMLAKPYATREPFFGISKEPSLIDQRFWHFLGAVPAEYAVIPIVVLDNVACLLYVQSAEPIPADKVGALGDVARAISAALTRLIRAANR